MLVTLLAVADLIDQTLITQSTPQVTQYQGDIFVCSQDEQSKEEQRNHWYFELGLRQLSSRPVIPDTSQTTSRYTP